MSYSSNESEDDMLSKEQADSPSIDEGSSGGGLGGSAVLKKGPWTSSEDAILIDYVKKHGEGNWNSVQKFSGLFRCGKSCRLRWANHLRPNLKKGAFTPDEERLIIELHAKLGNKWARMAAHLPGRTDNEIKNYWNTRIKRRQRAGLPLYPADVRLQPLNNSDQNQSAGDFNCGDAQNHDLLQSNNFDIPDVIFDSYKGRTVRIGPSFPDIALKNNMLTHNLGPPNSCSVMSPTVSYAKQFQESESLFPPFFGGITTGLSPFDQSHIEAGDNIHRQTFGVCGGLPYDPDPTNKTSAFGMVTTGSHALLNGNFSASNPPTGTVKSELPSLQYPETDLSIWSTIYPPHPIEAVDTYIQSPPPTQLQSDCPSPRSSGLLEALLYESHAQTLSSGKTSDSSIINPTDLVESIGQNLCGTEWEEFGDPISPLGQSAASVFSECTPVSGSSLDECPSDKAAVPVSVVKAEMVEPIPATEWNEKEMPTQMVSLRPNALINAEWLDQTECPKNFAAFFGDDFYCDFKQMVGGSNSPVQGWGPGSRPWNNMSTVCQTSKFP